MSTTSDRATTLHDVAARVGVSPRTVSRVVNNEGGFSDATRARVLDAVAELHYRPNVLARGLITRRTSTIALITPVISDPFFPEVAEGVQLAAREHGLTMFFATTDDDVGRQASVLASLEAHSVDGIIIFPSREAADTLLPFLDRGLPMVVIDAEIDHDNAAVVSSDLRHGARLAVDHLVQRGCREIGMIASGRTAPHRRRREDGFREALTAHGHTDQHLVRVNPTLSDGRIGVRRLLEMNPAIDGIFAYNDLMAIGAMQELHRMGRSVPDDVAIVGCDDIQMSEVVTPSLTSIRIDRETLGREAVRRLVELRDGDVDHNDVVIPVSLTARESA